MDFNQFSWQEVHVTDLHRIHWHICLILRPSDPLQKEVWHSVLSPHGKQVDWPFEATSHPENAHTVQAQHRLQLLRYIQFIRVL